MPPPDEGPRKIAEQDVMPLLLEAAPGFESMWQEHLAWWGDDQRGIFNDTGEFAQYLVENFGRGDTEEFPAVFATIERIIREGDDNARGAATIGVLESIMTIASHREHGWDVFTQWLGPLSAMSWKQLDLLWTAAGGSLAGVIQFERDLVRHPQRRAYRWWRFWRRKKLGRPDAADSDAQEPAG